MRRLALIAVTVSPLVGISNGFADVIPADYEALNRPAPELTVIHPFFRYKGENITGVKFSIDGSWYEHQCSKNDRNGDGRTCGKPITIDPGAHIFAVVICTRHDCSGFGKAWNEELRFTVGLREQMTIDLAKVATSKKGEEAIARTQRTGKSVSPCARAIEQAFYVNTCSAAGLTTFKSRLNAMDQICKESWSKNTDLLFELALWQIGNLRPEQCYKSAELKKLPRFLTEGRIGEGFWPPGTLKDHQSSWDWARSFDEESPFEKFHGEELRKRAVAVVDQWRERQLVVDQLIAAIFNPAKNLGAVVSAAAAATWDLNPSNPSGHRNFALTKLADMNSTFGDHPKLKALLAKGGAQDSKIHCAYEPEISSLVRSYLSDKKLTADEWAAIVGFLKRTPADESFYACEAPFRDDIASSISQEQRLTALAQADCADKRPDKERGRTLSGLLDPDHHAAPKPLRLKLMRKFADCVAF